MIFYVQRLFFNHCSTILLSLSQQSASLDITDRVMILHDWLNRQYDIKCNLNWFKLHLMSYLLRFSSEEVFPPFCAAWSR